MPPIERTRNKKAKAGESKSRLASIAADIMKEERMYEYLNEE
jgi:hypothetical protein